MSEQTLKQKTAKGLLWGGISNGAQQLLNLVFGLVLARILDASDYGMVGMLAIFSAIAGTLQESGFTAALTNQKKVKHEDYNAVFWFSSLTGVLFYILLFLCAPLIALFFNKPELTLLSRVVFLGFLLGGLGIASNAYMFKKMMVKERAKIDVITLLCSGLVGMTLALYGFAYYALAIQSVIYVGLGSLLKFGFAPWKPSFPLDFAPIKRMFSFSSKIIATNIFNQINNNIFSVVLGKFYTPAQLGFYSQGQKWMVMGNQFIGGMLNNISQPILVETSENSERQKNIFRKMVRFGAFVSFPLMFGLGFIGKEFIQILLGSKWLPSVPFLQLFCIWGAFGFLWSLYHSLLISHGKSNVYLRGMILTGMLQLCAVFSLFNLGIFPMVIGYIGVYYVMFLYWHFYSTKFISITIIEIIKDLSPYFVFIIVGIGVAYIITQFFTDIYIVLALKLLVVGVIYIGLAWVSGSVIMREVLYYFKLRQIK